jgi:ADP-ribosylation factor-like protein 3
LKNASGESMEKISPTHGFNIISLLFDNFKLTVWDIGGQESLRPYWYTYIDDCDGVIWVIDSADDKRLLESGSELEKMLEEDSLYGLPFLILANKSDLQHSTDPGDISEKLILDDIKNRDWNIQACSAKADVGVEEGFEWIVDKIDKIKNKNK